MALVDGQAQLIQAIPVDQVQRDQGGGLAGQGADLVVKFLQPALGPGGGDDVSPGGGQGEGAGLADAAGSSGDERDAPGKRAWVLVGHGCYPS